MSPFFASILAAIIVSLLSFLGIFFIFIKNKTLNQITLFLISFAIGGLLGDAFIHLIPESFRKITHSSTVSFLLLGGILLFFVLEKFIRWRHCHEPESHSHLSPHIITLNLIGDTVHNFIDGAIIAASFNVSFFVGLTTSLAVIIHEIPHEIGDFGIFVHNGVSPRKAIFYNFFSALASILGVILVFLINSGFSIYLIPITAGGFIYLAATDLIPELHRHDPQIKTSFIQLIFILFGISLMSLLLLLE